MTLSPAQKHLRNECWTLRYPPDDREPEDLLEDVAYRVGRDVAERRLEDTEAIQAMMEAATNALPRERAWSIVDRALKRAARQPVSRPRTRLTRFSAADLQRADFPAVAWVVPEYIPEGLTLFAGKPKLGKSWLMLDVADAVARGGLTLGGKPCRGGDVLYAALEDTDRRLASRMGRITAPGQAWPERLEFRIDLPRLDAGGMEALRDWIDEADAPRLIILDTLAMVRGAGRASDGAYEADYQAVSALKALAEEKRLAIVLVHHVRKMDAEDPLDTVSGTTGLTGAVDTVLVLARNGEGVSLYGRGRDIQEVETAVVFEAVTCRWRVLGEAARVRLSGERRGILEVLETAADALTSREIAEASGQAEVNVRKLLAAMARAGEVTRTRRGRYLSPDRQEVAGAPMLPLETGVS